MIKKMINLTIYILRYFSIIKDFDYKVSKKIKFGSKNADEYFVKNLKKSKYYLEYGSGSSTILAKKYKKKFLSIETDKSFFRYMRNLKIDEIVYANIGPTKYYSQPILPTLLLKNQIKEYASKIEIFFKKFNRLPDLVLIDGRFRVYVTPLSGRTYRSSIFKSFEVDEYGECHQERGSEGWTSFFRETNNGGQKIHCRHAYTGASAANVNLIRVRRHYWGAGNYKFIVDQPTEYVINLNLTVNLYPETQDPPPSEDPDPEDLVKSTTKEFTITVGRNYSAMRNQFISAYLEEQKQRGDVDYYTYKGVKYYNSTEYLNALIQDLGWSYYF